MKEAIDTFIHSLISLCPKLTESELEYIRSGISITTLQSKEYYVHANEVQKHIGFVSQGLIRCYYLDKYGKDITVRFIKEQHYATHYSAFISKEPSSYYFQSIEPSILVNLTYEHIYNGYELFPQLESYGRLIAEEVLREQQRRIESFLFKTAEERYTMFMKESPDVHSRVSLTQLSSFLGIERQSLTRIRKKLASHSL